jgi:hypothetical protein
MFRFLKWTFNIFATLCALAFVVGLINGPNKQTRETRSEPNYASPAAKHAAQVDDFADQFLQDASRVGDAMNNYKSRHGRDW